MIPKECKRLAEVDFPIAVVSKHAAREKSVRQGHISTLHIWWARRPLASSRATAFAAMIRAPRNHKELARERMAIIELSKWKNSLNGSILKEARESIAMANDGRPPKVLDPFAGGGS